MRRTVTIQIDDDLPIDRQLLQAALACAKPYDTQMGLAVILNMAAERMPCDSAISQQYGTVGCAAYHHVVIRDYKEIWRIK